MQICVYHDRGVSCDAALGRPVSARDLRDGACLREASLLIMPGGRDRFYDAKLRGLGNRNIRRFVEAGGTYLGICGGAYYAAARIEFAKGRALEVCEERELAFFPGLAYGPLFSIDEFSYEGEAGVSESGARTIAVRMGDRIVDVYYNGGCAFRGADAEVLGTYPGGEAAIIRCQVGRGQVVLSGVHLEKLPDWETILAKLVSRADPVTTI